MLNPRWLSFERLSKILADKIFETSKVTPKTFELNNVDTFVDTFEATFAKIKFENNPSSMFS